nr:hypothetical protein pPsy0462a_00078 [Pseudomonas syringae]
MAKDSNTQSPDNTEQRAATPAQEALELDAAPAASSIQVPAQSAQPQPDIAKPVASDASSVESQSPETAQVTEAPVGIVDTQVSTQPPLALSPAEQLASVEANPDDSAIVADQATSDNVCSDRPQHTPSDAPVLTQPASAEVVPESSLTTRLNQMHRQRSPQTLLPALMIRRVMHHLRRQTKKCPLTLQCSTSPLWRRPSQSSRMRPLSLLRRLLNNRRQSRPIRHFRHC